MDNEQTFAMQGDGDNLECRPVFVIAEVKRTVENGLVSATARLTVVNLNGPVGSRAVAGTRGGASARCMGSEKEGVSPMQLDPARSITLTCHKNMSCGALAAKSPPGAPRVDDDDDQYPYLLPDGARRFLHRLRRRISGQRRLLLAVGGILVLFALAYFVVNAVAFLSTAGQ